MLICTSSLLCGILHCIKSQQVFAKQKRESLVSCGLDGRYFGNEKIKGLSKLCYWQSFANMQTVFVFFVRS